MKTLLIALAASAAFTLPAMTPAHAQQGQPGQMQEQSGKQGIAPQSLSADQVRQVQQALKDKGMYRGQVDGIWGPASASALRQFSRQGGQGDTAGTGRIMPETLTALGLDPAQFEAPGSPPSTAPGAPPSRTQPGSPGAPGTSPGMKPDNSAPSSPGSPGTSPGDGQNQ